MLNFSLDYDLVLSELTWLDKCRKVLKDRFLNLNKQPKFFLHTFGCQGNVSESEKLKGMLLRMGYVQTNDFKHADFVLFNTCAVREKAQSRVLGNLGVLIHHKKNYNKNMIIAICGCMVQQQHVKQKILNIFPDVDLIFGTHSLHKFGRMVYDALHSKKALSFVEDSDGVIAEGLPVLRDSKLKAFVPIIYGCNNFCSYCIVPYVKGRERSRKFENIVFEVEHLVESGYKDITLLGQNVNSYGLDFGASDVSFAKLLVALNKINGDFRLRFLTSHPKNLSKNLIETIADCEKVCCHIHLPVQSGSDRILKLMNRGYTAKDYLEIVNFAKFKIKGLLLTTDIIVGFPSETYFDFQQTLNLVKSVNYSSIFNFIYSKRKGTKAAEMVDLVSKQEKTKWLKELVMCQGEITDRVYKSYVGKSEIVLFEGVLESDSSVVFGRTSSNLVVRCNGSEEEIGFFKLVKIVDFKRTFLLGKIL